MAPEPVPCGAGARRARRGRRHVLVDTAVPVPPRHPSAAGAEDRAATEGVGGRWETLGR